MNEPEIAPLAKRLAEENNVDWRTLEGTGENGRIVERDVLEYLARVMAGDEAVNPTPEPLPEGMEEWPEEEAGAAGARPGASDAAEQRAEAAAGQDGAEDEDRPGLLLEDDDVGPGDDLLVGGEAGAEPAAQADEEPLGLGEARQAPERPAPPEPGDEEDLPDLFTDGPAAAVAERGDDALFDDGLTWDDEKSAGPEQEVDAREDAFDFDGLPGYRQQEPAPRQEDEPAGVAGDVALGSAQDLSADQPEPAPAEPVREDLAGGAPAPATAADLGPAAAETPAGLARYRQILRRHVELAAAQTARHALARELGRADPVPLEALLGLAAHKAAAEQGLDGEVALARVGAGGVTLHPLGGASLAAALAAAEDAQAQTSEGAGLAVADLSRFGLDEAALDLDAPLLSMGRILTDSGDGTARTTVSLAGELPTAQAASLLARVSELLEEPIRLLA